MKIALRVIGVLLLLMGRLVFPTVPQLAIRTESA